MLDKTATAVIPSVNHTLGESVLQHPEMESPDPKIVKTFCMVLRFRLTPITDRQLNAVFTPLAFLKVRLHRKEMGTSLLFLRSATLGSRGGIRCVYIGLTAYFL
jgi:hypothetical protein